MSDLYHTAHMGWIFSRVQTLHLVICKYLKGMAYFLLLADSAGTTFAQQASSPPFPEWMGESERVLLPKVTRSDIDAVDRYFDARRLEASLPPFHATPPSTISAGWEVRKLGRQAAYAVIWLYAYDEYWPLGQLMTSNETTQFHQYKELRILDLVRDPSLASVIIPILRARVNWARRQLIAGTLRQSIFSSNELGGIEHYFAVHGSEEDRGVIARFWEELILAKNEIGVLKASVDEEMWEQGIRSARPYESQFFRPYEKNFDWVVKYPDPTLRRGDAHKSSTDPSQSAYGTGILGAGGNGQVKSASTTLSANRVWLWLVALILLAAILVLAVRIIHRWQK